MSQTTRKNIKAVYPLTPMQEGMLFHSLKDPESGVYVEQFTATLRGPLDVNAFRRSWELIIQRHSVLRTAFSWKSLDRMMQVELQDVALPLTYMDWRDLSREDLEHRFDELIQEDRAKGFDPARAPLMRLTLIRTGEEEHRLVWSNHHVLMDGWSLPIVMREIFVAYEAYSQGEQPQLPPAIPFKTYIDWLESQDLGKAEAFWRELLADFDEPVRLRIETTVPGQAKSEICEQGTTLSAEISQALVQLARTEHVTPNTVVSAAWALLLSRYSGQRDVVYGATVSGRPASLPGAETMVGLFINTLPLRVQIDDSQSLGDWLRDVQATQFEIRQYEYTPLVKVTEWSDVPAGTSLFESIFVYENYPVDEAFKQKETRILFEDVKSYEQTNYPLTVVAGSGEQVTIKVAYDSGLYDDDAMARMLGHLRTLLADMAQHPTKRVGQLDLLSEEERSLLLEQWNRTSYALPSPLVIHRRFEQQALSHPEQIAVVFGDESLSYAALDARANQLAHHLIGLGAGIETRVGIMLQRGIEIPVAILAVLKAGAAYVPIDPNYPRERIRYMIEDSGVEIILTGASHSQSDVFADLMQESAVQPAILPLDDAAIASQPQSSPAVAVHPQNAAYIIYTSGSTGRPKGVVIPHRNALNLAAGLKRLIYDNVAPGESLRISLNAPLSFDASVQQWIMLTYGHTLVIIPDDVRRDGAAMVQFIRENHLQLVDCVPTQLKLMIDNNLFKQGAWKPLAMLPGGEAIDQETWELLQGQDDIQFFNMYGPTECTVDSVVSWVNRSSERANIGRPLNNDRGYVLDDSGRPVPLGVPGELYLGGLGVARGYLNRPALTAERFLPDPFSPESSARMYRTGDLVRHLPSGELEFLGRVDFQVKLRGYRIELGEIETVLREHEAVKDVIVVVHEGTSASSRLVAFIIPNEDTADAKTLREYAGEHLPEYMVPSAFVFTDSFPLLPNGKIDRQTLQHQDIAISLVEGYEPPRTPTEELLADIWSLVLGVPRVGVTDNFFELGGHSLLATQLVSRVRDVFRVDFPLRQIFEAPTIAEMAAYIDALGQDADGFVEPPIEPVSREKDLPLSYAQQRLWFLDQLQPDSPFYTVPMALRLHGQLDVAALEQSLNEIVKRHETLRTTFREQHGEAVQVIAPHLTIPLPVVDLSHLPASQQEDEAHKLALAEVLKPFDLSKGPLLRVRLLKLADDEHVAVVAMHHIISDAWSMRVFFREMAVLYSSFSQGHPSPLPPLSIQYADYAAWQRNWLQGEVLERQMAYWREQLKGSPGLLALPTDRPRPPVQTANGANFAFEVTPSLAEQLRAFARKEGATLFMVLLAAFQVLLYRYTGQDDVSVGAPIANRNKPEIENLIGFFLNTLVLRTDLSGEPGFRELVKRVREVVMGAFSHHDLPFEMLVEELQPERDLSHTPLFQVGFTLQIASNEAISLPSLSLEPMQVDSGSAKYDITLLMAEGPDGLVGNFEYNTDLFDRQTIERMAGHLLTLLDGFMADPDLPIPYAPILTPEEQELLLVTWNDTAIPAPLDRCAHELFEARVEQSPDALAVIFEDQQLTYAQLNRRANQLARYLRQLGVGPETLVAISTNRSPEMIVGILATMKAGGAYLPVDPTYPSERIAFMLSDAGAPILLTQQQLLDRLPPHDARDVLLDAEWSRISQEDDSNLDLVVTSENTAYIIYTSGSTGKPKGAALRHRGLSNLTEVQRLAFNVQQGSRILQFAPFSFDASVWETFMALANGGTLCLARQEQLASGSELLHLMQEMKINIVTLPPSVLTVLHPQSLPDLKVVIAAGEKCTAEIVQQWAPGRTFFNAYGPTETTVCASMYRCSPDEQRDPPIGRPIGNSRLYVVDANLQITPVGVPGELVIGGVNVGRGYLNRPELTEQKFIPDPFAGPEDHLYRTGDLVRWLPDGNIEFLGRIDHQVKIRGFRIELGEIESVLRQHPDIKDVVVMARQMGDDKRLVAYLLAAEHAELNSAELRDFIRLSLPDYMVPSHFVVMDAFPLSPAGKVDRKALPEPDSTRIAAEADYVAPRNETEETLAAIAAELLAVDQVGVHDNFFELGGHSLLATQFISRVREAFDVEIELRVLFEHPTVAEIASEIDSRRSDRERVTETIADLLSQLDQLSDEEVKRLLGDSE